MRDSMERLSLFGLQDELPGTPPEDSLHAFSMQSVTPGKLKSSCELCAASHKKCSGPPGPCEKCLQKGRFPQECIFLPAKPAGPRPKSRSLSRKSEEVSTGTLSHHKRSREGFDESSSSVPLKKASPISSPQPMHSWMSAPPVLSANGFSSDMSSLLVGEVQEMARHLRKYRFLDLDCNTQSSFRNQLYFLHCIQLALYFWNHHYESSRMTMDKMAFVQSFCSFQEENPKYNYHLSYADLEKLFWLTGVEQEYIDPLSISKSIDFKVLLCEHIALIFLWLGPATLTGPNLVPANEAVNRIYDFIMQHPKARKGFQGFFSRAAAEQKLKNLQHLDPFNSVELYRLNEGRIEILDNVDKDQEQLVCYVRGLVRSRYEERLPEEGDGYDPNLGFMFGPKDFSCDAKIVHELIVLSPKIPDLSSTRTSHYRWIGSEDQDVDQVLN